MASLSSWLQLRAGKSQKVTDILFTFSEAFVSLMLQNKMINIDKKDSDGVNAFWIAAYFGHGKVMSVLAESGIDVMNTDPKGYNVLHVAAKKSNVKGYPAEEIITMLIKSGFPLDNQTDKGETAVAIAAQRGNLVALRALIAAKADVNTLNKHNLSPLYLAILNDHEDATEFLIDEGALAFIDGTDVQKDLSPIFLAIRKQKAPYIS